MHIDQFVRFWGRNRSDQEAIVFNNVRMTWGEVDAEVEAVARGLVTSGIRPGDRVGILAENRIETAISMLASVRAGAICAPLNFRLTSKELGDMVEDCSPTLIIAEGRYAELLSGAAERVDFKIFVIEDGAFPSYDLLRVVTSEPLEVTTSESDIAFICYTSGTTGVPKGAALTHHNILSGAQSLAVAHNITGQDRVLASAPLVYTGSGICMFMQMVVYPGATMVMLDKFDPVLGLQAIIDERITATSTVPVIWERMAMLPQFKELNGSDFRFAGAGGAPVSVALLEKFRNHGIPLTQAYGCTEASGFGATMDYEDGLKRPGYAGVALLGNEIRIARSDGTEASPYEIGEVMIKGPTVMHGYWNKSEETAAV